jgi:hypothetical protein
VTMTWRCSIWNRAIGASMLAQPWAGCSFDVANSATLDRFCDD